MGIVPVDCNIQLNYLRNLFAVSVLSRAFIIYFIYREIMYYMDSRLVFKFKPDTDMDQKLKIHIDVTVATPCSSKWILNRGLNQFYRINILSPIPFDRHRCWYSWFDKSECLLVRCAGRAGHMVGAVPESANVFRIYAAFKSVSTRRISFAERKFSLYKSTSYHWMILIWTIFFAGSYFQRNCV